MFHSPLRALAGLPAALLCVLAVAPAAGAQAVGLGTATSFAVLGGSAITNTGPTTVSGDLGLSPGTAVSGFPPGTVTNGSMHITDATAAQAQADLVTAYNDAAGRAATETVAGDLGGRTLLAGVYRSASTIGITGDLTLNAQGNPDAVFIFQIGSTLTTASASRVVLVGGAQACNVFWQVGSSATLGTDSTLVGSVLALTSVTANTRAAVDGRLLARNGAVTLDTNNIARPTCAAAAEGPDAPAEEGAPGAGPTTPGEEAEGQPPGAEEEDDTPVIPQSGPPGAPVLTGPPARCVTQPFLARVTGAGIARVTFFLDGRGVKLMRARSGQRVFALRVRPERQDRGVHRISARVKFIAGSGRPARTLRLVYQRCGGAGAPLFAG